MQPAGTSNLNLSRPTNLKLLGIIPTFFDEISRLTLVFCLCIENGFGAKRGLTHPCINWEHGDLKSLLCTEANYINLLKMELCALTVPGQIKIKPSEQYYLWTRVLVSVKAWWFQTWQLNCHNLFDFHTPLVWNFKSSSCDIFCFSLYRHAQYLMSL